MLAKDKEAEVKQKHADIEENFKFMDDTLKIGDFTTALDKEPRSDFDPITDVEKVALMENRQELRDIKKDINERLFNPQYPKLDPM